MEELTTGIDATSALRPSITHATLVLAGKSRENVFPTVRKSSLKVLAMRPYCIEQIIILS